MSLYQVAPLTWCPHLTGVERVPACGLDVKGLCEDCDNRGENWICLVCYKVSGGWGWGGGGGFAYWLKFKEISAYYLHNISK